MLAVVIAGCVHNIEITHFQTGQVLQGKYNEINRMVTVIMPDGEILKGKYSAVSNASFTFGTATAYSGVATATCFGYGISSGGQGQVYALLKSETSGLMMESVRSTDIRLHSKHTLQVVDYYANTVGRPPDG